MKQLQACSPYDDLSPSAPFDLSVNQQYVMMLREAAGRRGRLIPPDMVGVTLQFLGPLDVQALERAIDEVIQRHSALRTQILRNPAIGTEEWARKCDAFERNGITPDALFLQKTARVSPSVTKQDLRFLESSVQTAQLGRFFETERSTPLSEEQPLSLRTNLIRLGDEDHLLTLFMDHRVSDGWSARLLKKEVIQLYQHFAGGFAPLVPLRLSYAELLRRQAGYAAMPSDVQYWRDHWFEFAGDRLTPQSFPFHHTSPTLSPRWKTIQTVLDGPDFESLSRRTRELKTTLYVLFLAAVLAVLGRYTGRDRLAIWTYFANRPDTAAQETIGYFLNKHLIGFILDEHLSAQELLRIVDQRRWEATKHQRLPLPQLWREIGASPRYPDSGFAFDCYVDKDTQGTGGDRRLRVEQRLFGGSNSGGPAIGIYLKQYGRVLTVQSTYFRPLYSDRGVATLLQDVVRAANAIANDPEHRVQFTSAIDPKSRACISSSGLDEFVVIARSRSAPLVI